MLLAAAINWHSFFFLLFALVACLFALGVLFSSNVVRMAFYLVLSLGATAGLFFLAGAEFIGAMQIMIYVGGTLVLLIFGVMLTAQEAFVNMKTNAAEWVLAALLGGAMVVLLVWAGFGVDEWRTARPDQAELGASVARTTAQLGAGLVGVRVDKLEQPDENLRAGMSGYMLPFTIISMHLLVVLVGAAYLARTRVRVEGRAPAAAIPRVERKRHWAVTAYVWLWIVICAAKLISMPFAYDYLASQAGGLAPELAVPASVKLVSMGVLALVIAFSLVVLAWQKWGVYALAALHVGWVAWLGMQNPYFIVPAVIGGLINVGILVLLLRLGRPSTWSQME